MKIKVKAEYLVVLLFALFISACNTNPDIKHQLDTPTTGIIKISVDENYYPVIDGELDTFHSFYKYAEINPRYCSEADCFRDLLSDSARVIVVSRQLNAEEMKYFEGRKLTPTITKIASDAIAFIIHSSNSDTILSVDHLKDIFSGIQKTWTAKSTDSIQIIFDNKNSGTARYLKEMLLDGKDFPANCFALDSNPQVIEYVKNNKNAIGVIGVNWISDMDDPSTQQFLSEVKVISVAAEYNTEGYGSAYRPYQAWIAKRYYPFTREVYMISREARSGLGSGFVSFVAGNKGQTIILKSGLLPATLPMRLQQFGNGYEE